MYTKKCIGNVLILLPWNNEISFGKLVHGGFSAEKDPTNENMCKYTYSTLWDNLKLSKFYCNVQDGESFECENAGGK